MRKRMCRFIACRKQGSGGRPAEHCRRDIVDATRYLVKEGIQWRAMPADFPAILGSKPRHNS